MNLSYGSFFDTWTAQAQPGAVMTRMVRKTLTYVAQAAGAEDWRAAPAIPLAHALVLLDAALLGADLCSQSRSNYRNYLRRIYKDAAAAGIVIDGDGATKFWPPAPNGETPRRAQVAYNHFVRWALGRGVFPLRVRTDDARDWALHERRDGNAHWRQDYIRLQSAWRALVAAGALEELRFADLPARITDRFALDLADWPRHLRDEWEKMCRDASAPLRRGGVRPWRETTRSSYEARLSRFLGWFATARPGANLARETWATLLSAVRCQAFLNWLVARVDKRTLNPSHTGFLRMVRGFHRFLLDSDQATIQSFTDLARRCEVEERDKTARMVPYERLDRALAGLLARTSSAMKSRRRSDAERVTVARLQVDAIILGLLVTRTLRQSNIRGIRIGANLIAGNGGYALRFTGDEMKGHRKYETTLPADLAAIVDDYLRHGYRALTGRSPTDGEILLVTRRGTPFGSGTFAARVRRLTKRLIGAAIHPHFFRHIVATHAAQHWKMTPTELAAFLSHRSPLTVMKYYEVTSPASAAARIDEFRKQMIA